MAGNKTHDQQLRIIQGKENTKNGGVDLDIERDLHMSPEEREAHRKGRELDLDRAAESIGSDEADDRSITRGANQESAHHKNRIDDD
jgi:hypothetical protein